MGKRRMYPDFGHGIPPATELTLSQLAVDGIVSIDTYNVTKYVNGLLIFKIKLNNEQHNKSRTIEGIFIGAVEDTVRVVEDNSGQTQNELSSHIDNASQECYSPLLITLVLR